MDKNKTRVKANDGDDKVRRSRRPAKKRVCEYCQGHIDHVDYKDVERLKKYTAETQICRAARPDFAPNISATLRPLSSARALWRCCPSAASNFFIRFIYMKRANNPFLY